MFILPYFSELWVKNDDFFCAPRGIGLIVRGVPHVVFPGVAQEMAVPIANGLLVGYRYVENVGGRNW